MTNTHTLYKEYKAARAKHMAHYRTTAKTAMLTIRSQQALAKWRESVDMPKRLCSDGHEYIDANDYKYVFTLKADYDSDVSWFFEGYTHDLKESRHCYNVDEHTKEYGYKRFSGDCFEACIGFNPVDDRDYYYAVNVADHKYMRQFYNNKDFSKHDAYINMLQSTKQAFEQDIKHAYQSEYYTIGVELYAPNGEQIEADYIGSCDYEYASSGEAYKEYGLFEAMQDKALEHFATINPMHIAANYQQGMCI